VKPRAAGELTSLMELRTKSEIDSGSDDTAEQPSLLGADGKDDDSQSAAADAVARHEAAMESLTTPGGWSTESPGSGRWSTASNASPEKASLCPYCLKLFRYRSSYRRHVKIHEGIFSHECTVCGRKFTRKEHYVRHKCDRRPNKPYNVTNEVFRRMAGANQHAAARHVTKSSARDALFGGQTTSEDVPLELTTTAQAAGKPGLMDELTTTFQAAGKPGLLDEVPASTRLFTGGTVSGSTAAGGSLNSTIYRPPPATMTTGYINTSAQSPDTQSWVRDITNVFHMQILNILFRMHLKVKSKVRLYYSVL